MSRSGIRKERSAQERSRTLAALAVALAGHLALLTVDVEPPPSSQPAPSVTPADVEVELRELDPRPETRVPLTSSAPERESPAERPSDARRARAVSPGAPSPAGDPLVAEQVPAEPGNTPASEASRDGATRAPHTGPALSPNQLGIGDSNPFVDRSGAPEPRGPALSRRVDRVLAEGIANADQRRGLGPEGPVLASLETETRNGRTPPNSTALFKISTDGQGKLVSVDVLDANSDQSVWREIGDRVRARLRTQRLRGTHGQNGLTFEIRVISRVALPSGRDPGLAVDVLGLPVKKGEGKNSSRISILDVLPRYEVQTVRLPDGRTIEVPVLSSTFLGVDGDPVDVGAPARRMVHARLERLWAN